MAEPIWTTIFGAAVPTAVSLLIVLLTRERSGGADHLQLANCVRDVNTLKETVVDIEKTLAAHTTLHQHADRDQRDTQRRVTEMDQKLNQAIGREDGRRHQSR